jgi:uncharacterized protein YciW
MMSEPRVATRRRIGGWLILAAIGIAAAPFADVVSLSQIVSYFRKSVRVQQTFNPEPDEAATLG